MFLHSTTAFFTDWKSLSAHPFLFQVVSYRNLQNFSIEKTRYLLISILGFMFLS